MTLHMKIKKFLFHSLYLRDDQIVYTWNDKKFSHQPYNNQKYTNRAECRSITQW